MRQKCMLPGLLGVTFLTLCYTLKFPFMGDDYPFIVQNPRVQSWTAVPQYFITHLWANIPGAAPRFYRPLLLLLVRVIHAIFGLWAPGWHLVLLLSHLAACAAVYWLVRQWKDENFAVLATALFALHPVHAEVVSWVSVLCDPWLTVALLGALVFARRDEGRYVLASLFLFVIALGMKETAIVWPFVVFLALFDGIGSSLRRTLPFVGIAAGYLLLRVAVLGSITTPIIRETQPNPMYVPTALGHYFLHLVWPVGLSTFCELRPNAWILLFVLPVLAGLIWVAQRGEYERVAVLILIVPLLPALNLSSMQLNALVQDRYLYLPSVGFAMLAATIVVRFPKPAICLLLSVMMLGCVLETRTYSSGEHFYLRGMKAAPHNPEVRAGLGRIYASEGKFQQAIDVLEPFVREGQASPELMQSALLALAYSEEHQGKMQLALSYYVAAYKLAPTIEIENHIDLLRAQLSGGDK